MCILEQGRYMQLVIPTDDRKTVAQKTGRCKEFVVVTAEDGNTKYDYVPNLHKHGHHDHDQEHSHGEGGHSHNEILEVVKDADMFLVGHIGKPLKEELDKNNIPYQKAEESDIEKLVENFLK